MTMPTESATVRSLTRQPVDNVEQVVKDMVGDVSAIPPVLQQNVSPWPVGV